MPKTTSEFKVLQVLFLFLSLEFLSFPPEADFGFRYSTCPQCLETGVKQIWPFDL